MIHALNSIHSLSDDFQKVGYWSKDIPLKSGAPHFPIIMKKRFDVLCQVEDRFRTELN